MIRREASIECDRRKVKVEEQSSVVILESEGKLRAAENDAKAMVATAEGEAKSVAGLEVRRDSARTRSASRCAMRPIHGPRPRP